MANRAHQGDQASARQDQERFRLLVETVRDYAIFMLDPRGFIQTWNRGAERIKQYRAAEIVGKHFSIFYPEAARVARHPEHELEIAAREGRYEEEGWRIRKDGSQFWANVVITALRDESGELRGFAKVTRDLTDRRQVEEELRASEARLRLLIDSIRDYAIFMLDLDGRVATWNSGAERIKGYTAREILGKHFSVFYPPEDVKAGKCERELEIATATGRFEDEGWRVRRDGSRFWANVVIAAIRDEAGKVTGFAKVTRDLTERRIAEEERIRLARAEEALQVRDEFLSIASHELRTPLTSLQLQASALNRTLRKGMPDEETFKKLAARGRSIENELDRMGKLVNDLLDVSRAGAKKLHFELERVDLSELVRRVAARFADECSAAGCQLRLHIAEGLVGEWDPARLEQVASNFISNAIKYGAGTPIDIYVSRTGDRAVLAVRDQGIGVSEADQTRIFERFARAVSPANYGGLGLGLWIVRLIVEGMGGSVAVDSKLGQGATFSASLPIGASE